MNCFEYSKIDNEKLPLSWREHSALNDLEDFLQKNWQQRVALFSDDNKKAKQQFLKFEGHQSIKTNKYIGSIIYKNEVLNIYPRVFKSNKNDNESSNLTTKQLMHNLKQWIIYCNRINYPFLNINTDFEENDDLKELFISLFVAYVNNAIERSLYYKYIDETNDINTIKGHFDLVNYLNEKVSTGMYNQFKCTFSKFEFDNDVNRIIKYTCYQLLKISTVPNQRRLNKILSKLSDVELIRCKPADCDRIKLDYFHSQYKTIISMCKMFLLNLQSNVTIDMNDSFCFLFPTDLLFEGFVGGFLKETIEENGGSVYLQKSQTYLIDELHYGNATLESEFKMRHDIIVEYNGKTYILDTKYKEVSRFEGNKDNIGETISEEVKQADIYQVCEYARKNNLNEVFLIYPMYKNESIEPVTPWGLSSDNGRTIKINFVRLPFVFDDNIGLLKTSLRRVILELFN